MKLEVHQKRKAESVLKDSSVVKCVHSMPILLNMNTQRSGKKSQEYHVTFIYSLLPVTDISGHICLCSSNYDTLMSYIASCSP